jgi:class 3 adenylate cyclase
MTQRLPDARSIEAKGVPVNPFGAAEELVLAQLEALATEVEPAAADRVLTTVLFTDLVNSTLRASELGDRAWAELLERHHALVRRELARYRGTEVDTAGDAFFATFDGPGRAIRCAVAIVDGLRDVGLDVRAGIHTGECEYAAGKVTGISVVVGARVGALANAGEVLTTSTVKDLVAGSDISFEERGEHSLKGIPGSWRVYSVRM